MKQKLLALIKNKCWSNYQSTILNDIELQTWLKKETIQYNPNKLSEMVYIVLRGEPPKCLCGNYQKFNTFVLGYRTGCRLGNKCKSVTENRIKNQKITIKEKYGVDLIEQIPGVIEKRKQTMLKKYGTEYASQNQIIKSKQLESLRNRSELDKKNSKAKSKKTNLDRYGVGYPMQIVEVKNRVKEKSKKTCLELYGVDNVSKMNMSLNTLKILSSKENFINYVTDKTRLQVLNGLDIANITLYLYSKKYQASNLFVVPTTTTSRFHQEIINFIISLGIKVLVNDRSVITPKELDIFLPDLKIGIECNGLYWHSEISTNKSKDYHYSKLVDCRNKNVTLISIFEDEWNFQQEKVKNIN